ncbi:SDR family NAD(P)-dependent oxidoreductase [Myxococcota bacterium]|nr:SDR family NAD(P)-dependent oxidoreductase [Myxococcota bacterium]
MNLCSGKTVLVTGASRGIGAAIAQRFASEGAQVAVASRSLHHADSPIDGSLTETVETIRSQGGVAEPFGIDLSKPEQSRDDLVSAVAEKLAPVDILVNNAAANFYHPIEELSAKRFRIAVEVNLHAPLELIRAVVPGMRKRGAGWILNISSATAEKLARHPSAGTSGPLLYVSTKAALERATISLAEELYPSGIAVNALAPQAGVRTAAAEQYYRLPEESVEPVETMAAAALALCSGDPRGMTGRITRSLEFLVAMGAPVHLLDGKTLLEGWQPDDIPEARTKRSTAEDDESSIRALS